MDCMKILRKMALDIIIFQMEQSTQESLKMEKFKDQVNFMIKITQLRKVYGKMASYSKQEDRRI